MKLAVVGSRDYHDEKRVRRFIRRVAEKRPDTVIISGGARGVDTWAVDEACKMGLKTEVLKADWDRYGRSAGMRRNGELVELADKVKAFWDGSSRGTLNTINRAKKAGKLV